MKSINTHLSFNGNALEAFEFYRSVFGGEFEKLQFFKELPGDYLDSKEQNRVMHVSLPVSKNDRLLGCDTSDQFNNQVTIGNNFSLSVNAGSKTEADLLFSKLAAGGKIVTPMREEFWGAYFGMLIDKYSVNWMISFEPEIS